MPVVTLDGSDNDKSQILAVMLFPEDQHLRRSYFAIERTEAILAGADRAGHIVIDALTLQALKEAPSNEQLKTLSGDNAKQGKVAGRLLAALYLMYVFKVAEPSFNKALYIARCFAEDEHLCGGNEGSLSESKIRDHWRLFKSVAHFWAAYVLNASYSITSSSDPFRASDFGVFPEVAAVILEFGCLFVPFRAKLKVPILERSECWQLPAHVISRNLASKEPLIY